MYVHVYDTCIYAIDVHGLSIPALESLIVRDCPSFGFDGDGARGSDDDGHGWRCVCVCSDEGGRDGCLFVYIFTITTR